MHRNKSFGIWYFGLVIVGAKCIAAKMKQGARVLGDSNQGLNDRVK